MRLAINFLLSLVLVGTLNPFANSQQATPAQTLSDAFSKAGLKAMFAIRGDLGELGISGAAITVPARTQDLLDNAHVEASTSPEVDALEELNHYQTLRATDNGVRHSIILQMELPLVLQIRDEAERLLVAQQHSLEDFKVVLMDTHESECYAFLEAMLRARTYRAGAPCGETVFPPPPPVVHGPATLIIYRRHAFEAHFAKPTIWMDGAKLAKIANGTYSQAEFQDGQHSVEAIEMNATSTVQVNAEAHRTYYVRLELGAGTMTLNPVSPEQAESDMQGLKSVPAFTATAQ